MNDIIYINPKEIIRVSSISGCNVTRNKRIQEQNLTYKNGFLNGDWDVPTNRFVINSLAYKDYQLFKNNKLSVYPWINLYNSIKENGYIQDLNQRYIEVGLGRTGEFLLIDGRHRLIICQDLGIQSIPMKILDIHPEYNFENLSIIQNNVIPSFLYKLIASKWNKEINIYHHWETINHRYNLVKKYLPLLKGLNVLEIGPNSGMMMWSIMKYADTLIELELQEKYFNQCEITKISLKSITDNYVFIQNNSLNNFQNSYAFPINALYASFVLYHLSNEEVKKLKEEILPNCKVVLIPNRNKERGKQKNSYFLNRPEEIKKLLESCGFKVTIDESFEKGYSVIVGVK